MAGTEVLTGSLMETASGVEELVGRYRQSVDRLFAIGHEIDSMWDGLASSKFAAQLGQDRERFDAMAKLLESYIGVLRQNAGIYTKAENDVLNVLGTNTIRRS